MSNHYNPKIEICGKCQEKFLRKMMKNRKTLSTINDVNYWTENKGWRNYQLLCRSCLKNWKIDHYQEWRESVHSSKKSIFNTYLAYGALDQDDKVID